jgi:hypothetical protein
VIDPRQSLIEISNMGNTDIKQARRKLNHTSNHTGVSHFAEDVLPVKHKSTHSDGPLVLSKGETFSRPTERWYKRRKWRIFLVVSSNVS